MVPAATLMLKPITRWCVSEVVRKDALIFAMLFVKKLSEHDNDDD